MTQPAEAAPLPRRADAMKDCDVSIAAAIAVWERCCWDSCPAHLPDI